MTSIEKYSFDKLIDNIYQTHSVLQENALKVINQNLTIRNWLVGCYIVEYEQNGEDRAKYGAKLIDEMSKTLKVRGLKGFSPMALRNCRIFYSTYPQIQQTLSVKLRDSDNFQAADRLKALRNSLQKKLSKRQFADWRISKQPSKSNSGDTVPRIKDMHQNW